MFIDGDLTIDKALYYQGKGTLIVSGDVYFPKRGGTLLPGVGSHDPDSYPEVNALGIATPNDIDVTGAFFAQGRFRVAQGANMDLLTDPDLPENLPPSLPGGDDQQQVFMTRWHDEGDS